MALNRDFLMGFVSGAVVGAVGYRLYEQNGGQLQRLVQPNGVFGGGVPQQGAGSYQPSVEELVAQKERLEDMIAELQV
ncbi:hypothetical protein OF830_25450 [Bacillus paramycoides]|uniref:hypothetical protein n=1 Tax=Bacillus paramycoides TaxID=2026194 RepID=UPI0022449F6D|nr:hypothetical protein [Bacillus paramycoides]MCW9134140.1 hypothetical protein [Bacillus paramycoides]